MVLRGAEKDRLNRVYIAVIIGNMSLKGDLRRCIIRIQDQIFGRKIKAKDSWG